MRFWSDGGTHIFEDLALFHTYYMEPLLRADRTTCLTRLKRTQIRPSSAMSSLLEIPTLLVVLSAITYLVTHITKNKARLGETQTDFTKTLESRNPF